MQELPSLKAADPEVCFALAKHPGVVNFLMSKHQSPGPPHIPAIWTAVSGSDIAHGRARRCEGPCEQRRPRSGRL
eukprot:1687964-Rhodomonas_salina.1